MNSLPPNKKKETLENSTLKVVVLSFENRVSKNDFFRTLMISASPSWLTSLFSLDLSFFLDSNGEGGLLALEVLGSRLLALGTQQQQQATTKASAKVSSVRKIIRIYSLMLQKDLASSGES